MIFIFDLDGTLTTCETLPVIAKYFSVEAGIEQLTKQTVKGDIPFIESFIKRVGILGNFKAEEIASILRNVPINETVKSFIDENIDSCVIATGNYRGWVSGLASIIGCELHASEGTIDATGKLKLSKILKKEELVKKYQALGHQVVFIGDGNNDAEAMRIADVSIACGLVHSPSNSVMQVADYVVYDSIALVRLLNQIKHQTKPQHGKSVVISAAGTGSRLGLGQTKSLIPILGQSLIKQQISLFSEIADLRVVVGFQARELIEEVLSLRKDVVFVFNHDYFNTKTGASLYLGSRHANEFVIAWDGDLIVHPDDVVDCLSSEIEYIGISKISSEDSVFVKLDNSHNVISFSRETGDYEWSGPACIRRDKIRYSSGHVYIQLEEMLPMPSKLIRACDIDTDEDYQKAIQFVKSWKNGNFKIEGYYDNLAKKITSPIETRNKALDFTEFDVAFVKQFSNDKVSLLDLGAGTGLLINKLCNNFAEIVAVEKYKQFSDFITNSINIKIVNTDILNFFSDRVFDLITIFGVMNFFNSEEAMSIYKMARKCVSPNGTMLVKHQMGINQDVIVDGYSQELSEVYYSEYRSLVNEKHLIAKSGFNVEDVVDIYPAKFNRWKNTHFYALVCKPSLTQPSI